MSHTKKFLKTKNEEKTLCLDDEGLPVTLYHGTNRTFNEHSEKKNRTILNEKYQGDWFCYSDLESVAWKYASAARNQNLNKEDFLKDSLDYLSKNSPSNIHNDIYELINTMMNNGYSQGFEIFEKDYEVRTKKDISNFWQELREFEKVKSDFNIDEFCEVLEFVEHSKTGISDSVQNIQNIFNQQVNELPNSTVDYLKNLGYKDCIPQTKIIKSNILASKILKTKNREKAINAKDKGYDLVIYSGVGTVDGEPEYLIANKEQIIIKEIVNKYEISTTIDSSSWRIDTLYETIKQSEISDSIREKLHFEKINAIEFKDLIKHNFKFHSINKHGDLNEGADNEILFKALLSEFIKEVEKRVTLDNGSICLYRQLGLKDINELQLPLGRYWSYNADDVDNYDDCGFKHTNKESHKEYVIKADIPLNDIDWNQTFNNYVISEFTESEITINNNSNSLNIEYKIKTEKGFTALPSNIEQNYITKEKKIKKNKIS
jgi:hypothetical protein